jgi:ABC-type phosphate transport system substrate-binding protein
VGKTATTSHSTCQSAWHFEEHELKNILVFFILIFCSREALAQEVAFIVNAENPITALSKDQIKDYYYKRKRTWPDGTAVRFIEAGSRSPVRKQFVTKYLGSTVNDADLHWIGQKLYSGDSAPLQQNSESMIIQFVANLKGAIGYVSSTTPITNKKVKVLQVEAR